MRVCLLIRRRSPGSLARMMVLVLATALLGCVPQAASAESGLSAGLGTASTELGASAEPEEISATPSTTKRYTPCPSGSGLIAECNLVIDPVPTATPSGYQLPNGTPLIGSGEKGGLDPADMQSAYKLPTTGGSGETVALVDAYGDSTAESDLNEYREKYKVYYKGTETACTKANKGGNGCFKKVNVKGEEANYPAAGPAIWGAETALDIEMVSAACPECHILLVEASGEYPAETAAAVEEAAKLKATEISNSYGYSEDDESACPSKKGCKEYLAAYNQGIPVMASAGDGGYDNKNRGYSAPLWPAVSPNVISVGGTELTKVEKPKEGERGWEETVWPDSGSGCSMDESEPAWQEEKSFPKACKEHRTDNDVASVAEGVSIYTTPYEGGWGNVGGTSASSPFVAGVEAHETSATKKLGAEAFYKYPSMLFHISKGSNGSCGVEGSETYYLCHATKEGYNGPTGWGTPDGVFTSSPPENTALPVTSPVTPDQAVPESTTTGTWTNEPTSYTYQWERCNATGGECKEISGATSPKYTPVEADVEHTLVVKVTAKNGAGEGSALSKATNKVEPIGKITEYSLPTKESDPNWITAGPDGNVWFTEWKNNTVAKITPSGTITEYAIHGHPEGITAGPDGNLWAVESSGSEKVAKITPSGTVTESSLPSGSEAIDITAGPDGNLWFTETGTSRIGKITTSGTITEYNSKREGFGTHPWGITAGPDGNLWFTDREGSGAVAKITTSGTITEYLLPEKRGPEGSITVGPEGNLWYTTGQTIGKITTSGTITEYTLPKGRADDIVSGPDGNLWFTAGSYIGKMTTSGTVTEYSLPKETSPRGIAVGPDDNIWFTCVSSNKIGKITP